MIKFESAQPTSNTDPDPGIRIHTNFSSSTSHSNSQTPLQITHSPPVRLHHQPNKQPPALQLISPHPTTIVRLAPAKHHHHHHPRMAINVTPFTARILVAFVCILIFSLAYPTQYIFLHPYNRLYAPWWTGWHTLWFNFCVLSIWISYARSVGTDPGGLPRGKDGVGLWVPDGADELGNGEKREEDVGRMKTGKLWGKGVGKWCKKCEAWKPPRCHHCRKCERCVLRMDHHCGCIFLLWYTGDVRGQRKAWHCFYTIFCLFTMNFKINNSPQYLHVSTNYRTLITTTSSVSIDLGPP